MWRRHFIKNPPGDNVTHELLARIGYLLDLFFASGEERTPKFTDWAYWLKGELDSESETDDDETVRNVIMERRDAG